MRCKKNNLLVVPCDTPLMPLDLFERLQQAMDEHPEAMAAYAVTQDGPHPLCCLLHPSLSGSLGHYLDTGYGSVVAWLEKANAVTVAFDDADAFRNFNTLEIFQTKRNSV